MTTNIIELFKDTIGSTITMQSSASLGESAQSISTALDAVVPALLGSMILKGDTDPGARGLSNYISDNGLLDLEINEVSFLDAETGIQPLLTKGSGALEYLVGSKISPVMDWLSGAAGLKSSSTSTVLKMVAPLLMGFVGRMAREKDLGVSGFKDLLLAQGEYVKQSTPPALIDLLGLSTPVQLKSANGEIKTNGNVTPTPSSGLSKFLPWLVLLIASLGLFYFLQKGCNAEAPATPGTSGNTEVTGQPSLAPPGTSGKVGAPVPFNPTIPVNKDLVAYPLPNQLSLKVEPNTFIPRLGDYMKGNQPAGKCFILDRVGFEPGSAVLLQGSRTQLSDLASILKAYPEMKIDILAYMDNQGDDNHNQEVSDLRAAAIQTALFNEYILPERINAKGMGEQKPIASNETFEGQEKNRRVEICVVKKK